MAGKFCDVCEKDDIGIAGVASSSLGAFSFAFCPICAAMGAEPKFMIEATIETCNGIENIREGMLLAYYDSATDTYIDKRTGHIPIQLKDGIIFETRAEMVKYIESKESK